MVGLGPQLFPDLEDSTAGSCSKRKWPGKMSPCQPTWETHGCGAEWRDRTPGLTLTRGALYQLS
jgi:hypothetical protein